MGKLETALQIVGALGTILTLVGSLAPAGSPLARFCARWGADLRGVRQ